MKTYIQFHYESLMVISYLKVQMLIRSNTFDTLLFYCLRSIENNGKTMKTIEIIDFCYFNVFVRSLPRICESLKPISQSKKIL